MHGIAVGVIKMGNIDPTAGIESKSLAFRASVLPSHHIGSLMSPPCPCIPVYIAHCLKGQCRPLQSSHCNCKSFNAYNYVHAGNGLTYTYTGQVREPYRSWSWNQCCGGDENRNIVPRVETEPTYPAFNASVLPLHTT